MHTAQALPCSQLKRKTILPKYSLIAESYLLAAVPLNIRRHVPAVTTNTPLLDRVRAIVGVNYNIRIGI